MTTAGVSPRAPALPRDLLPPSSPRDFGGVGKPARSIGAAGQRSLPDRFRSWRDPRMGSGRASGVQPALLQVTEGTKALLIRAADSRHRSPGPRRAERRPPPVRREVPGPRAHRRGSRRGRQGRRRREGPRAGGFVQARIHLQDAPLPRRDSGGSVGVDRVPGAGSFGHRSTSSTFSASTSRTE